METTVSFHSGKIDDEDYHVAMVPPALIQQLWPRVEIILRNHPARNTPLFSTTDQIFHRLMMSQAGLWIGGEEDHIDTVLVFSIVSYPAIKTLVVNYVGGRDLRKALLHWNKLETYAREMGCTHIEMITRPGIVRLLRKVGFRPLATYTCKSIVMFSS
jgi:hypothetical protein